MTTFRTIAYTFVAWTVISIFMGAILGTLLHRHQPRTPKWWWED